MSKTRVEIDGKDMSDYFKGPAILVPDGQEIVGELHYPGDVRSADVMVYSPPHGRVYPIAAEYDEEADRTTVYFAGLASPVPA